MDIFTSLEFKKLLDDVKTRSEGLLKFTQASEKFDSNKKQNHDIVKSYISSSADCAELLQCFKGEVTPNDLLLIFRCLIQILTRTASDLEEFYGKVGMSICDALLRSHLQKVYHALGLHQSPRAVSNGLKMLTLLVMQGKEAARDMADRLDFNLRCFKDILKRFKGKISFDIRKAYIQFVISFFMSGDVRTINRIFDARGFASVIFQGMDKDTASTIQMVLTAILDNGVKNSAVSKSSKVRFFAEAKLLKNIARLFEWDGIFDIKVKGMKKHAGKQFVHNMVHNFLYYVCCPSCGITFLDKEWGVGEKCKNPVLLEFILHLITLTSEPLVQDLIVKILKACPDLLPRFMKDFRMTLEPKSDKIWLRNCELVRCVYENQPDVAVGLSQILRATKNQSEQSNLPDCDLFVRMILPGIVSPNFSCIPILKHCMKSKSSQVKEKALNLLLIFMQKLDASITFMLDKSNWDNTAFNSDERIIAYARFEDAVLENYLTIPFLVQLWKELSSGSEVSLKILLLKIIRFCQKLFPQDVEDTKFDFSRLLNIITASSQLLTKVDILDVTIIDMLSENPRMCRWFKIFDKGNTSFKILLNVIQNSPKSSDLYKKSVRLCEKVVMTSEVFQPDEIIDALIWIENIVPDIRSPNDQTIVQYLNDICSKVARTPMKYFDILSIEKRNASKLKDKFWESLREVDIAKEVDWAGFVIMKSRCSLDSPDEDTDERDQAMSLLAVAALDNLKDVSFMDEERKILDEYLVRVFFHLLNRSRNARNGEYFARVYERCISEITRVDEKFCMLDNFGTFLTIWTKKQTESLFKTSEESLPAQLQSWLWKVHKKEKPQFVISVIISKSLENNDCNVNNVSLIMSQCLLYFDTLCVSKLESSKELFIVLMGLLEEMKKRVRLESTENASKLTANVKTSERWILQNLNIQALFFQDIFLQQDQTDDIANFDSKKLTNTDMALDSLCTYAIAGLLVKKELSDVPKVYTAKIISSIPQLLRQFSNELSSEDMDRLLLPIVFHRIQHLLTASDCKVMVGCIVEILPTIRSKKTTKWIAKILCTTIEKICSLHFRGGAEFYKSLHKIFDFMSSNMLKNQSHLIGVLSRLIQKFPWLAEKLDKGFVESILKKIDSDRVKFCVELTRCNPDAVKNVVKDKLLSDLPQQERLIAFPLVHQVLGILTKDFESNAVEIRPLFDIYWRMITSANPWEDLSAIVKSDNGKSFLCNLFSLCYKFGMEEDVVNFVDSLNEGEKFMLEAGEVSMIIECVFSSFGKVSSKCQVSLMPVIMKLVTNCHIEETFSLLRRILDGCHSSTHKKIAAKCCPWWAKFVRQALMKYFDLPIAIQCITKLFKMVHPFNGTVPDTGIDIGTLQALLVSHSKFFPSIMDTGPDKDLHKCSILELHYELALRCATTGLSPSDYCYLLSGYTATLSKLDQVILKTLLVYEQKGVNLDEVKPFLWGKSAISSYRARKNLGENLWKKPGCTEVLSCIDDSVMDFTLTHFPVRRRMIYIKDMTSNFSYFENDLTGTISASKNEILKEPTSSQNVYDPCFLLPSFLHILSPENLVDCKIFVQSGALAYLFCCLASHCHTVRAMAANCLMMFYHHAQTAWFSENNLTMYLIRCVRNSIPVKDGGQGNTIIAKLPTVVANFLAAVVQLHLDPKDHMFSVLHRYILIKPQLDLKDIPEFFVLFFSAEMESKIERTWVVNLVCNSLRDQGDINAINKRNVIQLLMCLHDSAVSENFVRRQIFEVFERIVLIRSAAFDLVKNKGFISWLSLAASNQPTRQNKYSRITQTTGRPGQRRDDTGDIIRVLSTLCNTLDATNITVKKSQSAQNETTATDGDVLIEKMEIGSDELKGCKTTARIIKTITNIEEMEIKQEEFQENAAGNKNLNTGVEKMEVNSSNEVVSRKEKKFAVIPFRILKQIMSLAITLQENLLAGQDFDVDFCEECLEVLSSCITEMNTRNYQIIHKNNLKKGNSGILSDDGVRIICETVWKLLQSSSHKKTDAVCHAMTVLMAWQPDSSHQVSPIWDLILKCAVVDAKSIWTKNIDWLKKNFVPFCKWLKICASSMDWRFESIGDEALTVLYDVILQNITSEMLQSDAIESFHHVYEMVENDTNSTLKAIKMNLSDFWAFYTKFITQNEHNFV